MFTVIQSILVYGIMVWIMTYNAKRVLIKGIVPITFKQFITNKNILFPLILFSLLAAIRWDVGVDCRSYIYGFYKEASESELAKGEILFYGIQDFFKFINLTHIPFFFTIAFIQLAFIYYGLRKKPEVLYFFPLMFVLYGTYWSYMNGMRQNIACSIFIFVILLSVERKWKWAIIWVFIATLFHRSAYVLFIIGAMAYLSKNIFLNKYIQLGIITVCYAMMGMSIWQGLEDLATEVLGFAGYEEGTQEHLLETVFEINFGFRAYLMLFANLIVIFFSKEIKKFYNSTHFNIMYNLYFVGVCVWVLFYGNHGIERISMYLTIFIPVIIAATLYYLYKNRRNQIYKLCFYAIIILLSVRTLYDCDAATKSGFDTVNYKTIFSQEITFN